MVIFHSYAKSREGGNPENRIDSLLRRLSLSADLHLHGMGKVRSDDSIWSRMTQVPNLQTPSGPCDDVVWVCLKISEHTDIYTNSMATFMGQNDVLNTP